MRIGSIAGIPIYIRGSLLILAVAVTFLYGRVIASQRPELARLSVPIAFGFVVLLILSILLHEAGHAYTARRSGLGVKGITLELLGGYTELDRESPTPGNELLVALAGPVVSFVLGGLGVLGAVITPNGSLVHEILLQLAVSNLVVAVFNALPGLPLDGGRALRGLIWAITGDASRAGVAAGWAGRIIALASAVAGCYMFAVQVLGLISFIFVGVMATNLWISASQAIHASEMSARFPSLHAGSLAVPLFPVASGTPLAEALRMVAASGRPDGAVGVVDSAGMLRAVVDRAAAAAVPPQRLPWVWVDSVARSVDNSRRVDADLRGVDLVHALQADPATEYLVSHRDHVVGVLRVADVIRLLERRP
jgi:Zn-dependent protease